MAENGIKGATKEATRGPHCTRSDGRRMERCHCCLFPLCRTGRGKCTHKRKTSTAQGPRKRGLKQNKFTSGVKEEFLNHAHVQSTSRALRFAFTGASGCFPGAGPP